MPTKQTVIGLVATQAEAEKVVAELQRAGFSSKDVSALFADKQGTRDFAMEKNTKAPEGAVTGVGAGGVLGGTLGLLAGIGALAIPGLGPFIAAGPIMAALSGAAAGAAVGGIAGALVGMGIPELEAKQYEGRVKDGHVLLSVHTDNSDERARAKQVLQSAGAVDVVATGEKSVPAKQSPASAARH
jgi:hypothetical protein